MKTIVGGGLSGLATAISLSLKGEDATIIERSNSIGSKFPESVHGFRNYHSNSDEKEFIKSRGYSLDYLNPIYKIIKYGPSLNPSTTYSNDKDKPMFYAVKRGHVKESIDMQLLKQAEELNVNFRLGETVPVNQADIIATGATFMNGLGYGHHYRDVDVEDDTIIFLLDDNYAPKGYAYAIPYGRHEVSIVVTSFDPSSFNQMPSLYARLIEKVPVFSKLIENVDQGTPFAKIGFYYLPETAKVKEKLIVGEAAGFVEADRGFGMHYALESGYLAAKSIVDGVDYDLLWKSSFESQLLKAFGRRLVLDQVGNNQYDKLINAGTVMSTDEYLKYKEAGALDSIKKIILKLQVMNEAGKLRRKYDLKRLYS